MSQDTLQNIVLAMIQGFAEIFPISSSGHLAVYGSILGQEMSFDKVLLFHLGTFFAILYFYRKEVASILTGKLGWRTPRFMLVSFLTTVLVGLAMERTVVNALVQRPRYVAALWFLNGLIVALIGILSGSGFKKITDLQAREYVIIGVAQGIAALPGISRLGLTLGAGLLQELTWFEALKLSFLLSLPTILGANLLKLFRFLGIGPVVILHLLTGDGSMTFELTMSSLNTSQVVTGVLIVLTALGCGLVAIEFLSRFLGRRLLRHFGLYCMVAGSFFWLYLSL